MIDVILGSIFGSFFPGPKKPTIQFIAKQEVYMNQPPPEVKVPEVKPEPKIEVKPEPIKEVKVEPKPEPKIEPVKVSYEPKKEKYIINKTASGGEIVLTEDNKSCFDKKYMFGVDGQNKIFPGCWEMVGQRLNLYYDNGERYSYPYDTKFWKVVER